ncbi:thiol peroxidase [Vibrio barjaei]|uniref:thiol peroxidase n=1 Tax=Vibrio barjaei TaxID=1676683 RepID=UPI002285279E|nr:thiol peroxidase [Vibrio barjaei]MCY9873917.1 thiol peroxidase [Vibrio barjaei]
MTITFQGSPQQVSGRFLQPGDVAPDFKLRSKDLEPIILSDFRGKWLILNIFLSVDTPVCASSVKEFSRKLANLGDNNVALLCISADLPFALGRFLSTEKIENIRAASCFQSPLFTRSYGVNLTQGVLKGLAARAVIVIDENGIVKYSQLVKEITEEPNYELALKAIS